MQKKCLGTPTHGSGQDLHTLSLRLGMQMRHQPAAHALPCVATRNKKVVDIATGLYIRIAYDVTLQLRHPRIQGLYP